MTDPIRVALERAVRELERVAGVAARCGLDASARRARNEAHAARTALSAAPPITYEWSITVDGDGVAGGGGPDLEEVERDAAHCLLWYERDGATVLQIRSVQIIKEISL